MRCFAGLDQETMLHLSAHQQSKGKAVISEADMAQWAINAGVDVNAKDNRGTCAKESEA